MSVWLQPSTEDSRQEPGEELKAETLQELCLLISLKLTLYLAVEFSVPRGGTTHGGTVGPALLLQLAIEKCPQTCPQDNLIKTIIHLRFPLPGVK